MATSSLRKTEVAMFARLRVIVLALWVSTLNAAAADRIVYLTFDDGPLNGTSNVLDVLAAEKVPATLFMVGLHVEASADHKALLARAKSMPLLTVGNHSYSHAHDKYRAFYADAEAVVADMLRANKVLGLAPVVHARLPGRDVFRLLDVSRDDLGIGHAEDTREEVDFEFVAASGFELYGWDHEWIHEASGKPVQSVDLLLSEIDHLFGYGRFVEPGKLILLMHDEMFQDSFNGKANLQALIQGLKQRGYTFGHIADYDG
jgi:peptidoglycan/xylan/chitin deacetylase (PgdA/CDA1 family)